MRNIKYYVENQQIKILKGKNKGKVGVFVHYIKIKDVLYLVYSLYGGHRAKILPKHTCAHYNKYKGVDTRDLCSVCFV